MKPFHCYFNFSLITNEYQYPGNCQVMAFYWFSAFLVFLNYFFNSNWRLVTLQYCGGFCHTLTWISHGYTCVPHPDPPSHLPHHPIPQGHPSAPALSTLPLASNLEWRSISHMIIDMFQCYSVYFKIPLYMTLTQCLSYLWSICS